MNRQQSGQLTNHTIETIETLLERISDPNSTVREIDRLVSQIPQLKGAVIQCLQETSKGRITAKNCAQAIVMIGLNRLARLAVDCLLQLSEQLDGLTFGPHRLTPPELGDFKASQVMG